MTQRQLDLSAASIDVNSIPLDLNHKVEIREKGQVVGIYTLSGPERKKRGVALPLEAFIVLQEQLSVINLKIQLASGTVGLDLVQGYGYAGQHSSQPPYSTSILNGVSYEQETTVADFKSESLPQWQQPCTGSWIYTAAEASTTVTEAASTGSEFVQASQIKYELCHQGEPAAGSTGPEFVQPSQIKYELCQQGEAVKYYYG